MQEEKREQPSQETARPEIIETAAEIANRIQQAEMDRQIAEAQREVAAAQRQTSEEQREVAAKLRQALTDARKIGD